MAELIAEATNFAQTLTRIVTGTVTEDASFVVTPFEDDPIAWIFPAGSTPSKVRPIPMDVRLAEGEEPRLWLRVLFQVRLDDAREHLAVESSVFGLCVNPRTLLCAVRIEYDRDKGSEPDHDPPGLEGRSAAHVQIHGASAELAYAAAVAGRQHRALETYHIPVGGRRFRPSLEDFIQFLASEELIPEMQRGWRRTIGDTRKGWMDKQLRAAVRNAPEVAADQLRAEGYEVTGSPTPSD